MIDTDALRRDLEKQCLVLPGGWPGRKLDADPADMNLAVPQGYGFAGPLILRPWDKDLGAAMQAQSVYGLRAQSGHPVLNAPLTNATGGVVYFDDHRDSERLGQLLWMLGLYDGLNDAAVFCAGADDPLKERYLHQIRIVPRGALRSLFAAQDAEVPPKREPAVTFSAIIRAFVAREHDYWNHPEYTYSPALSGLAGGDGDWAKEALAFGIWAENPESAIYRVWSRAWLVTK